MDSRFKEKARRERIPFALLMLQCGSRAQGRISRGIQEEQPETRKSVQISRRKGWWEIPKEVARVPSGRSYDFLSEPVRMDDPLHGSPMRMHYASHRVLHVIRATSHAPQEQQQHPRQDVSPARFEPYLTRPDDRDSACMSRVQ